VVSEYAVSTNTLAANEASSGRATFAWTAGTERRKLSKIPSRTSKTYSVQQSRTNSKSTYTLMIKGALICCSLRTIKH
jgi:hypothetical protein